MRNLARRIRGSQTRKFPTFLLFAILTPGVWVLYANAQATSTEIAVPSNISTTTLSAPDSLETQKDSTDSASTAGKENTFSNNTLASSTDLGSQTNTKHSETESATSTPNDLRCTLSHIDNLYDTPSGHLDDGYAIDLRGATETSAHIIGTQAWTECNDSKGNVYEFKISQEQYTSLRDKNPPIFKDFVANEGSRISKQKTFSFMKAPEAQQALVVAPANNTDTQSATPAMESSSQMATSTDDAAPIGATDTAPILEDSSSSTRESLTP